MHGFRCCNNIAPNAKCQLVFVLALCLVKYFWACKHRLKSIDCCRRQVIRLCCCIGCTYGRRSVFAHARRQHQPFSVTLTPNSVTPADNRRPALTDCVYRWRQLQATRRMRHFTPGNCCTHTHTHTITASTANCHGVPRNRAVSCYAALSARTGLGLLSISLWSS